MCKIKSNNSYNYIDFLFVVITVLFLIFRLFLDERIRFLKLISLPLLLILILVFIYMLFKQVEIIIENKLMIVKWKLFGLSYKNIKVDFNKIEIIGSIHVYFYNDKKEIASFRFDNQDLEPGEEHMLSIEMKHNGKTHSIGNKRNADKIFKRIIECCTLSPSLIK